LAAAAPAVTQANTSPSAVTSQIFSLLAESKDGSRAYLKCASSLPAITAASRPDFSIPARIASLAGTATSITSAVSEDRACRIYGDGPETVTGSYTYAVSAATGDVKFNGQSLASNWFLRAPAEYTEQHIIGGSKPYSLIQLYMGLVSQTLSTIAGARFQRNFIDTGSFTHSCNSRNSVSKE
jgi:hypothetical protein